MKEKQIEEMANELALLMLRDRNLTSICTKLYNAGYRKQRDLYFVEEGKPPVLIETSENKQRDGEDTNVPTKWISVEEAPKTYRDEYGELIPFLVCCKGTVYPFRAVYDGKCWGDGIAKLNVTHWMPLPEVPKGETK